jgi:hypothetical protein
MSDDTDSSDTPTRDTIYKGTPLPFTIPTKPRKILQKIISTFIYLNTFLIGAVIGYICTTILVCTVNIGRQIANNGIFSLFVQPPKSPYTIAYTGCGSTLFEQLGVYTVTILLGIFTMSIWWYIHYIIRYSEHPFQNKSEQS